MKITLFQINDLVFYHQIASGDTVDLVLTLITENEPKTVKPIIGNITSNYFIAKVYPVRTSGEEDLNNGKIFLQHDGYYNYQLIVNGVEIEDSQVLIYAPTEVPITIEGGGVVRVTNPFSGTSGTSGRDGSSGSSGRDGTSGSSGINGSSGTSGVQGEPGTSGSSGTSGTSGTNGTSGISGTSGQDGTFGTSGSSGVSGSHGTSGANGLSLNTKSNIVPFNLFTNNGSHYDYRVNFDVCYNSTDYNVVLGYDTVANDNIFAHIFGKDSCGFTISLSGALSSSGDTISWLAVANGESVIAGTSGTSGANGSSGTSGYDGTNGSSGVSGSSGSAGTSGVSGTNGTTGTSGSAGSAGTSGTSGLSGFAQWTPVVSSGITQSANSTFIRTNTGGQWNEGISSLEGYLAASVSAQPTSANNRCVIGLNSDPVPSNDIATIDYCIGITGTDGIPRIYESNVLVYSHSTGITTNTLFTINYDGLNVRYYIDNTLVRTVARTLSVPLYLDSSLFTGGGGSGFKNVTFTPSGISGTNGTSGSAGTSGTSGSAGSAGSAGTSGTSGSVGTSGTSGVSGSSGTSGTRGTSGSSGSAGTSGTSGSAGSAGSAGTSGTSGSVGTSGTSGRAGSSGVSGSSGTAGTSGIDTSLISRRVFTTNDTLVVADKGKMIEGNSTSNLTLRIPLHATEKIPVGSQMLLFRINSGEVTISPANGVTLYAPNGARLAKVYSVASLIKRFENVWVLAGDTKI